MTMAFVAQHLNHCATAVPQDPVTVELNEYVCVYVYSYILIHIHTHKMTYKGP